MPVAPDLTAVKAYLGDDHSWSDTEVEAALAAETAAQRRVCRLPERTVSYWWVSGPPNPTGWTVPDPVNVPVNLVQYGDKFLYPESGDVFEYDGSEWVYSGLVSDSPLPGTTFWVEPLYPDDLAEALCRRVAANLANRGLPLGVQASMTEMSVTTTRVGGGDAEVRRLERPWRRLVVG